MEEEDVYAAQRLGVYLVIAYPRLPFWISPKLPGHGQDLDVDPTRTHHTQRPATGHSEGTGVDPVIPCEAFRILASAVSDRFQD